MLVMGFDLIVVIDRGAGKCVVLVVGSMIAGVRRLHVVVVVVVVAAAILATTRASTDSILLALHSSSPQGVWFKFAYRDVVLFFGPSRLT